MTKRHRRAIATVSEAVRRAPEFRAWRHADKIRFIVWYLHIHGGLETVRTADVARCFAELSLDPPSSISPFLARICRSKKAGRGPDGPGYRLDPQVLEKLDIAYGGDESLDAETWR